MDAFNLDTPLLTLSSHSGASQWTARNAVEGVQIFGGIGSGKTSGSGRMIALKYLNAGFGGLVLTVKPDERELWEEYCSQTGRAEDLIIVGPEHQNYFNFLEYESSQAKGGNALTENIVQVLKTVIRASEEKEHGTSDDPFWETALDMLIFNILDLCKLAYGQITLEMMYDICQTLPKADVTTDKSKPNAYQKAFELAQKNIQKQASEWDAKQDTAYLKELNDKGLWEAIICNALPELRLMRSVDQFFDTNYKHLSDKTRSIIDFSFSGFLFRLMRDPGYSLFCKHATTFIPEDCLKGKIILLDIPVKLYHKVGRDCQIMFKYIWQRSMEKRNIKENDRPVFLWADEAQNFLHEHDADYQATARSSRIATVYISQNLPNYLANMGGAKSEFRVKSFLGTLGTKIFHANADIETNRYASELIGDTYFEEESRTATMSGQYSTGRTKSVKVDRLVRPEEFARLKTGGTLNDGEVEGYMHVQGNVLKKDFNCIKTTFNQDFILQAKLHSS